MARWLWLVWFLLMGTVQAQTPEETGAATTIQRVLLEQTAAWNRGDIPEFMKGYENSETTTFVGKTITKGYQKVLASYLKRYPTQGKMGTLTFNDLEIQLLGMEYASVLGKWNLVRSVKEGGTIGGIFTLLFRKTDQGWKIIQDHTS